MKTKISHNFLTALILLLVTTFSASAQLQKAIDDFAAHPTFKEATYGVCVMDINSGMILGSINEDMLMIPASTMKTVTCATALKVLGADFRFKTKVYHDGNINSKGVLNGNIIIVGGGDPSLESEYIDNNPSFIQACVDAIIENGITEIKGDIITDKSHYATPATSPYWLTEDLAYYYGAGSFGINYADNSFKLQVRFSGEKAQIVGTVPETIPGLKFDNRVKITTKGHDSFQLTLGEGSSTMRLLGNVKRRKGTLVYPCANPNPDLLLRHDLINALTENKIKVANSDYKRGDKPTLIFEHKSVELPIILKSLLIRSDNMYAESVIKTIAHSADMLATSENGGNFTKDFWQFNGIDSTAFYMYDGSGLSKDDLITPRALASILKSMKTSYTFEYPSLFPLAGVEGTVKSLLAKTDYSGLFAVKSGSMRGVQSFAGYYPVHNPRYVVVVIVNNYRGSRKVLYQNIADLLENSFSNLY
ncbi:MAG: D-alanyl-D-alanine carboxypeptidase/D-alanyl-D-alanine-endopeptidase [Bacteroidales bacterium]